MERVWNVAMGVSSLKKNEMYLIDPDDFVGVLTLSPYTVFERGLFVRMSGMRLIALLTMPKKSETPKSINFSRRSKRNICLKDCGGGGAANNLPKALERVNMPLCMKKIMLDLSDGPRGNKYKKRFEFNCYLANILTCTKCKENCLIEALLNFYRMDGKCVNEVTHLLIKAENIYKPSNCAKLKSGKLCPTSNKCKGSNPICNY